MKSENSIKIISSYCTLLRKDKRSVTANNLTYVRPFLYPKQEEAIFCAAQHVIIEGSTKSGKTLGCLFWLFEEALYASEGSNCWWIAPTYAVTKIAFRRLIRGVPVSIGIPNYQELSFKLINQVTIFFKTGEHPDHLYGEDVVALVLDEASRMKPEVYYAAQTVLFATRGKMRIIGNRKGMRNWNYELARKAENGLIPNMKYFKLTAKDAVEGGITNADELASIRARLPSHVASEAFDVESLDDGGNPFGYATIERGISNLKKGPVYVYGIDLAKRRDWTVIIGLNRSQEVCEYERFQLDWKITEKRILAILENKKPAQILIDATGIGDAITETIAESCSKFCTHPHRAVKGFVATKKSKIELISHLIVTMQKGDLKYPDNQIVKELKSFNYYYKDAHTIYEASPGEHDDCVFALALANLAYLEKKPKVSNLMQYQLSKLQGAHVAS